MKKSFMITRYNYKWKMPEKVSSPYRIEYELVTTIEPISFNDDKSIKEYKEISKYVEKKSLWEDYIKSFDLGSISEQVLDHITKGTPLVTAHTLPPGDYTKESLLKGAEIIREMRLKGLTLDDIENAMKLSNDEVVSSESEAANG